MFPSRVLSSGFLCLAIALVAMAGMPRSPRTPLQHYESRTLTNPAQLAALLQQHVHPIQFTEASFEGPGLEWIIDHAEGTQFVMFGEQHGVDAIPRFVATAYQRLQPVGFDHLALEIGPWIATKLSTMPLDAVLERWPYSITFDYDGELELLRTAQRLAGMGGNADGAAGPGTGAGGAVAGTGAASASPGRGAADVGAPTGAEGPSGQLVWGIDQMITAIHPFERLVEIAPGPGDARIARGFFLKAAFKTGQYLRQGHYYDLGALRGAFAPAPGSESEQILDAAEVSMRIFTLYHQQRIDESVEMREIYMTELLSRQHDAAAVPGAPLPRAVFKMGGAHIIEGIGPNGVATLGDFAQKLAATHGSDALNIGIRAYNVELFGLPPELIEGRDGILIDYRSLRTLLETDSETGATTGPLAALSEERLTEIRGFDAVIYLVTPDSAPDDEIHVAIEAWIRRTLTRVTPIATCLVILLTALAWPLAAMSRAILRVDPIHDDAPAWAGLIAATYAITATALIGWQAAVLLRNPLTQPIGLQPASVAPVPLLLLLAGAIVMLGYAVVSWRRGFWGVVGRVHYTLLSIAALVLVVLAWMWRLPGIPG